MKWFVSVKVTLSPSATLNQFFVTIFLLHFLRSRKRRTSYTQDERDDMFDGDDMDECNAALVLMSLSCSPNSPRQGEFVFFLISLYQNLCHVDEHLDLFDIQIYWLIFLSLGRCTAWIKPRWQYWIVQWIVVATAQWRWQCQQQQHKQQRSEIHHQTKSSQITNKSA